MSDSPKTERIGNFILEDKPRTITKMVIWKIPRNTHSPEIRVKIGRYKKTHPANQFTSVLENEEPKSALTLTSEELNNFLKNLFLNEKIAIIFDENKEYNKKIIEYLNKPENKKKLSTLLNVNDSLVNEQIRKKQIEAILEFEKELNENNEKEIWWQDWFEKNKWVFSGEIIRIINNRKIDQNKIADMKFQSLDGFLDIVELKTPQSNFWVGEEKNYYPSQFLTQTISQASRYIFELEREMDSQKAEESNKIPIVKPRCTIIFGRSNNWNDEQKKSFRILNSNYHNLQILTFDHVLSRGKQILGLNN